MPTKKKNSINTGVPGGKTSGQCPGAPKKKSVKVINNRVTSLANMFQKVMIPTSGRCPGAPKKKSVKVINKGVTWAKKPQVKEITPMKNQSPKTYAQEQEQKKTKKSKTPAKKSKK